MKQSFARAELSRYNNFQGPMLKVAKLGAFSEKVAHDSFIYFVKLRIPNKVQPEAYYNISIIAMDKEILADYRLKDKLGKGAYGQVVLAENNKKSPFAIKMIVKANLDQTILEYLEGQINCMMSMSNPHVIKMYERKEDEDYIYLICQYCNGGDLFNYQSRLKNRIFTVEEAVAILSDVIRGLEALHDHEYLHRDIKLQNILISKNEKGIKNYKLGDLGFAKQIQLANGTVLGTEKFMAPQIFSNQPYGFEVDMWSFGVVFFFMLNMAHPFNLNPYIQTQLKTEELRKLSKNFSYKDEVMKTNKKNTDSCLPEIESLFKKIFDPNPDSRIKFSDIRETKLFSPYFPEGAGKSKILYENKKKFESRIAKKNHDIILPTPSTKILKRARNDGEFLKQKIYIETRHDILNFLRDIQEEIKIYSDDTLTTEEKECLCYNIYKLYIILLKKYVKGLALEKLQSSMPNLNWENYCSSSSFKKTLEMCKYQISSAEMKLQTQSSSCEPYVKSIQKINKGFSAIFEAEITENKSGQNFMLSYKTIVRRCFTIMERRKKQKRKYLFLTVALLICYVFDEMITDSDEQIKQVFKEYFKTNKQQNIDFEDLRNWIQVADISELTLLFKSITSTARYWK